MYLFKYNDKITNNIDGTKSLPKIFPQRTCNRKMEKGVKRLRIFEPLIRY